MGSATALPIAVLFAIGAFAPPAAAHQINLSNARVELEADRAVNVEVALKGSDVDRVAGTDVFEQQSGLVDAGRHA